MIPQEIARKVKNKFLKRAEFIKFSTVGEFSDKLTLVRAGDPTEEAQPVYNLYINRRLTVRKVQDVTIDRGQLMIVGAYQLWSEVIQ